MQAAYTTDAYFARLDALFIEAGFNVVLYRLLYWQRHRLAWAAQLLGDYVKFIVISMRLLRHVKDPVLRTTYRTQLARALRALWRNPHMLFVYAMKTALHFHYAAMTRDLGRAMIDDGAIPEAVRSFSRAMPAASGPRGRQLTSMQVRT
jgi:hypothetical protein